MKRVELFIFFSCYFIFCQKPSCQSLAKGFDQRLNNDSLLAIEYYNIADTSYNNVDTCIRYSHLALPLLERTDQTEKYLYILAGLSHCYTAKENYDSLESNNYRAYQMAKKHLAPEHFVFRAITNNLGKVYEEVYQDYDKAIALYQSALTFLDSTNTFYHSIQGTFLKNMGNVYLAKGDFDKAILYLKKSLGNFEMAYALYVHEDSEIYFKIIGVYQNIAQVYHYQHFFLKEQNTLLMVLDILENAPNDLPENIFFDCYFSLAESYLEQEDFSNTSFFIRKCFSLKNLSNSQRIELNFLNSKFHFYNNDISKAELNYKKALSLTPSTQRITLAKLLSLKAQVLSKERKYANAIETHLEGIKHLLPNDSFSINSPVVQPYWKIYSRLELINHLQGLGTVLKNQPHQKDRVEVLNKSLNCFLIIAQLSDQLQADYQGEESKLFLNKTTHSFYEEGISVAYELIEKTKDNSYLNHAFYFFEKSKAAILLGEIKTKEATGIYTIPSDLIEKKYQLQADINFIKRKIKSAELHGRNNTPEIISWNNEIFELTREQAKLKATIQIEYPQYLALTKGEIPSLLSIQSNLSGDDKSGIIEYFLGEKNSYAFFITHKNSQLKKINEENRISSWVKELVSTLKLNQFNSMTKFKRFSHVLYSELLGIFDLEGIDKLIIIPDGDLASLPFDILLPIVNEDNNPRNFDYLIKSKNIKYAYSSSLLQLQQKDKNNNGRVLTIAPIFKNNPDKYLPYSEKDIIAFNKTQHMILRNQAATVDNFLNQASDFGLLYFSTHASSQDSVEQQPAIEFINQNFYLTNLYATNLSAHLVVLSACETGIGEQQKGEGIMSLARGFTYAGVPSVMTTLWKVNEKTTNSIIQDFFLQLKNGYPKDKALRNAKINYLQTCPDTKAVPYYWAGFSLIGNDQPFTFESKTSWWGGNVGICCLIFAIFLGIGFLWLK